METFMKSQLPMLIRYGLVIVFTLLAAVGLLSEEQNTFLSGNLDVLAGAVGTLVTIGYAVWKRPSAKALEVAKQVDKEVPKGADVAIVPAAPGAVAPGVQVTRPGDVLGDVIGDMIGNAAKKMIVVAAKKK